MSILPSISICKLRTLDIYELWLFMNSGYLWTLDIYELWLFVNSGYFGLQWTEVHDVS